MTVIVVGITIISRKKSEGILHESDNNIITATTDIKAKPIEVAIPAHSTTYVSELRQKISKKEVSVCHQPGT